jgi:glycosyltransferase involved in cell wall biosynthesis
VSALAVADAPTTVEVAPERILLVSPYAPYRDGIGSYAVQQVRALRREGHHVEVLSPRASAAHHHLDLHNPRSMSSLARLARGFDRLIVHFHPDVFFPQPATFQVRLVRFLALGAALRSGPPATLVLHEIDERWGQATDVSGRAARFLLQSFDRIEVHYETQGDQLVDSFGVPRSRIHLIEHGENFVPNTTLDRDQARAVLGIAPDEFVFLCIGFVARHKGFDRAVTALGHLPGPAGGGRDPRVRLDVVGAPSTGSVEAERYALELESLAATTPGAHVHLGYVSDSVFDRWLIAADTVVLPYRFIWSSSVVERAELFDRPVIASAVGGLAAQVDQFPGARLVADDRELVAAMTDALVGAGILDAAATAAPEPEWEVAPDGAHVLAEVRRRAEARRGYRFVVPDAGGTAGDPRRAAGVAPLAGGPLDAKALGALRRIGPLARPQPVSGRPGVGAVKRLQRRLLNWEIEPVIGWVDELRRATQQAVEATAAAEVATAAALDKPEPPEPATPDTP